MWHIYPHLGHYVTWGRYMGNKISHGDNILQRTGVTNVTWMSRGEGTLDRTWVTGCHMQTIHCKKQVTNCSKPENRPVLGHYSAATQWQVNTMASGRGTRTQRQGLRKEHFTGIQRQEEAREMGSPILPQCTWCQHALLGNEVLK